MSKNVAMFVDVANMYYAARGQDVDVDYVALLKHATKGRDLIRAYAYSGLDPENENQRKFLDFLTKNGYKVVSKDIRKFGDGRVKANLDIELVVDLFRLADRMDIAVIVSGDGDFASAIRALQDKGVRCEVISFRPNTSSDLIAVADEFFDIMKVASIERGKASKVMAAPEMPAKEVNPEFGFREASRSVAAAALAALRTGEAPAGATRLRRPRTTPIPTAEMGGPVDTAPEESAAAILDRANGEEGRRRRRRRGGRGRGRRRDEGTVPDAEAGTPDAAAEIGWEELDDLSQIDGGSAALALGLGDPDSEIGFEEVDEATLAELGLSQPAPAAPEADDAVTPAAKPRRATRSRSTAATAAPAEGSDEAAPEAKPKRATRSRSTAATAAPAEGSDEAAPEAKPKRATRSRGTAAKAAPAEGSDEAAPEAKPKRATRSRSTAAKATPAEGSDEAQGIWQRFRSGRTTR